MILFNMLSTPPGSKPFLLRVFDGTVDIVQKWLGTLEDIEQPLCIVFRRDKTVVRLIVQAVVFQFKIARIRRVGRERSRYPLQGIGLVDDQTGIGQRKDLPEIAAADETSAETLTRKVPPVTMMPPSGGTGNSSTS